MFEDGEQRQGRRLRFDEGCEMEMADRAILFNDGSVSHCGTLRSGVRKIGVPVERFADIDVDDGQRHHRRQCDSVSRFQSHGLHGSPAKVRKEAGTGSVPAGYSS